MLAERPRKGVPSIADLLAEKKKSTAEKKRQRARSDEFAAQIRAQGPAVAAAFEEPPPLELPLPLAAVASAAPEPACLQRCLFPDQVPS